MVAENASISEKIALLLNQQIQMEAEASNTYLAMASWADTSGYEGIAAFMYKQSEEEREHMIKLFQYLNERGGFARVPQVSEVPHEYPSVTAMFEAFLSGEVKVTQEINSLVEACLVEKDYVTHNFMQWYVSEQMEEEHIVRTMLDRLRIIGSDKSGMYLFDRDCLKAHD